jgi:hypothetical protein
MTIYVVKAKPKKDLLADLKQEMISGKISRLRPFGEELHRGLEKARIFEGMYTGWKRIIALRHLQWKGEVYWIAILTISQ